MHITLTRRAVLAFAPLALLSFGTAIAVPESSPQVVARTVAAFTDVTDAAGRVWKARTGLVGGSTNSSALLGKDVLGTTDDAPYQASTYSSTGYVLPVPSGRYRVRLLMADGYWTKAGQRVFDVTAEGATVLSRVDIVAAVGQGTAYDREFDVEVADGALTLGFVKIVDNPLIAAVEVTSVTSVGTPSPTSTTSAPTATSPTSAPSTTSVPSAVVARTVAAFTDVTDAAGRVWKARTGLVGGSTNSSALLGKEVLGTTDDVLYQASTYTSTGFVLPVATGRYSVRVLMADGYWTKAGQRVFDVTAEEATVLSRVDIVSEVGPATAYERSFAVNVTDGALTLGFVKVVDNPLIAAIEVTLVGPVETPSPTTGTTRAPETTTNVTPTSSIPPTDPDPTSSLPSPSSTDPTPTTSSGPVLVSDGAAPVPLGQGSPWITRIGDAPLDPESAEMAANLRADVLNNWGGIAAFNSYHYNSSYYRVPAGQPRVDVDFVDCQNKRWVDPNLFTGPAFFTGVPIPDDAQPARGTDAELTIHDPATDQLWEFWQTARNPLSGNWEACWGGRVDNLSASMGIFPRYYGATGTGVVMAAGMIGLDEVRRGSIDHAMYLGVMNAQAYPAMSWPALRTDGNLTGATVVREGQRLRLDPIVDVDSYDLTPIGRMVAVAAQKYGFVVSDRSGAVAVVTESGQRERALTGSDPWALLLGRWEPYEVLRNFPWEAIQVVEADWGKPADNALATPTPSVAPTTPATTSATSAAESASATAAAPVGRVGTPTRIKPAPALPTLPDDRP